MSTRSAAATQVLFDAPGPKGRRRILLISIVSVLAILALLVLGLRQFAVNGQLEIDKWTPYLEPAYISYLWIGVRGTLTATAVAAVFAFPLGLVLALGRISNVRAISWIATAWIEFFRGVPVLLVVYAFFLLLPRYEIVFPQFWMLVIPMILVSSATTAEVFRAGIGAVDRGQHEAAAAIGLSGTQSMFSVILPQAVRLVLPSLVLALVSLLKDSTIGYVVSYTELQFIGKNMVSQTRLLVQTYLVVSAIYIVINFLLTRLANVLDRRMRRRAAAGPASRG